MKGRKSSRMRASERVPTTDVAWAMDGRMGVSWLVREQLGVEKSRAAKHNGSLWLLALWKLVRSFLHAERRRHFHFAARYGPRAHTQKEQTRRSDISRRGPAWRRFNEMQPEGRKRPASEKIAAAGRNCEMQKGQAVGRSVW